MCLSVGLLLSLFELSVSVFLFSVFHSVPFVSSFVSCVFYSILTVGVGVSSML